MVKASSDWPPDPDPDLLPDCRICRSSWSILEYILSKNVEILSIFLSIDAVPPWALMVCKIYLKKMVFLYPNVATYGHFFGCKSNPYLFQKVPVCKWKCMENWVTVALVWLQSCQNGLFWPTKYEFAWKFDCFAHKFAFFWSIIELILTKVYVKIWYFWKIPLNDNICIDLKQFRGIVKYVIKINDVTLSFISSWSSSCLDNFLFPSRMTFSNCKMASRMSRLLMKNS